MLPSFQCDGIRIRIFERSSNIRFCLVRGSTSGSFFFGRDIYWHSRAIPSGSFFFIRDKYWQVRGSSTLIRESFRGGLSLVDGRLRRIFSFLLPLIIFFLCPPLPFLFLLPLLPQPWMISPCFWGTFWTAACHGICFCFWSGLQAAQAYPL